MTLTPDTLRESRQAQSPASAWGPVSAGQNSATNSGGLSSLRMWEGVEFSGLQTLENKGQTQIELGVIILHRRIFNFFCLFITGFIGRSLRGEKEAVPST